MSSSRATRAACAIVAIGPFGLTVSVAAHAVDAADSSNSVSAYVRAASPPTRARRGSIVRSVGKLGKQHVGEAEAAEIPDAHRIQDAVEMVAFMLDDARVKTADLALDHLARRIEPAVMQLHVPRYDAAKPRYRQAPFPAVFELVGEDGQYGIDELGVGHRLGIGIARI